MDLESTQNNALAKLPLLKQEDGNSFKPVARTTTNADGTSTTTIPGAVTAEEKIQKKNDLKTRSILMMTLPSEHLLTFNQYKDVKTLFEAIEARFGGNEAIKKTQKTLLKQMNKPDLGSISFDDLYNNFKIVEQEVKRSVTSSSNSNPQNVAFVSTPSSTNDVNTSNVLVNTASSSLSTASTTYNTARLKQIHEDDLEEMDLKWQLALLSMKARKFYQRTGKKIIINGSDTAGYDKTKVECFNCHKMGHFARECKNPRSQENRSKNQDSSRRTVNVEESSSKAMLAIDGVGFDWSFMTEEEIPTNFALMAFSDSEVHNNKTCSKTCLKSFEDLKSQYDNLRIELNKSEFDLANYKRGLASVEEQLVFYKKNEGMLCDQIDVLKRDASFNEAEIIALKTYIEKLKKEKEDNQISDNNKSASENVSKEVKKTSDAPIIEDWVSDCDKDETVVLESLNVQKPKQADQPRKSTKNNMVINAPYYCNEALAIPGQTATGKELSNPFMAELMDLCTKSIDKVTILENALKQSKESHAQSSNKINMLIEKKYPLKKEILEKMINLKIEAEEESYMAHELIKFIKSQIAEQIDFRPSQTWISQVAHAEEPPTSFDELNDSSFDFSTFVMNRLKIPNLTQEILVGPAFNLLKGTCKSIMELEYHLEECSKATTERLDWHNPENKPYPFDLRKPLPLIQDHRGRQIILKDYFINKNLEYLKGGDLSRRYSTSVTKTKAATYEAKCSNNLTSSKDVYSRRRIIAVTRLTIMKKYDYGHLEEIEVRRDDQKLYTFKEGDFKRLRLQDIEDHNRRTAALLKEVDAESREVRCQNRRDLPRDIPLDNVVVLRYEKRRQSENKGKVLTEMELVLEQTQQGTSYEVSYEYVGPEVTRSQEGKSSQDDVKRLCLVDDLKEVQDHIHVKSKIQVKA
ncbi:ribonuclease H-like domain-containing protein [Tanacetum coccineum]|uniref:Ribonuclease H-like domain-containing protein n=1 Tax=Tanacetum coccineum TaxID=301880 RepID=A0ABQ5DMD3_9ASTR